LEKFAANLFRAVYITCTCNHTRLQSATSHTAPLSVGQLVSVSQSVSRSLQRTVVQRNAAHDGALNLSIHHFPPPELTCTAELVGPSLLRLHLPYSSYPRPYKHQLHPLLAYILPLSNTTVMDRSSNQPAPARRDMMFCHECADEWYRDERGLTCPECGSDFTEIVS
jgi:hypothetical protein